METRWNIKLAPIAALLAAVGLANRNATAQSIENVRIWRLQVRVRTAPASKAGTDSNVWVQLNGRSSDRYWLNNGRDDRKQGRTDTWDVTIPAIRTVRDITQIRFGNAGKNGWAFDRVELLVNNDGRNESASRIFTTAVRSPFRVSSDRSDRGSPEVLVADSSALRRSLLWNLNAQRRRINTPPFRIPRTVLESIIEGSVGHLMGRGQPMAKLKWGKKRGRSHVQIRRKKGSPESTVRVDLDLNWERGRKSRFRAVDVDFDLRVRCSGGRLVVDVLNIDADLSKLFKIATLGIGAGVERIVKKKIGLPERIELLSQMLPRCGRPRFDSAGNLIAF